MKPETDYQQKIIDAIKATGGYAVKIAFKERAGCPDLLVGLPGFETVLVEVKKGKQALDPMQLETYKEMIKGGVHVVALSVRYNTGQGVTMVDKFDPLTGEIWATLPLGMVVLLLWADVVIPTKI